MIRIALLAAVLSLFAGCYVVRSKVISASTLPRGTEVHAEDSGLGLLYLTIPELYVRDDLAARCRKGEISGTETTLSVRDFLLVQYWKVKAEGVCRRRAGGDSLPTDDDE